MADILVVNLTDEVLLDNKGRKLPNNGDFSVISLINSEGSRELLIEMSLNPPGTDVYYPIVTSIDKLSKSILSVISWLLRSKGATVLVIVIRKKELNTMLENEIPTVLKEGEFPIVFVSPIIMNEVVVGFQGAKAQGDLDYVVTVELNQF